MRWCREKIACRWIVIGKVILDPVSFGFYYYSLVTREICLLNIEKFERKIPFELSKIQRRIFKLNNDILIINYGYFKVQRRERNRYLTRWSSSFLVVHLKKSVGFSLHHSLINEITKCRTPPKSWFIASLGNNITFNIQFDILIDRRITPLDWSSSSHFTHPCYLEQHFILQSQNFFDVTSKKKKKMNG